jgi:hypothetical protein
VFYLTFVIEDNKAASLRALEARLPGSVGVGKGLALRIPQTLRGQTRLSGKCVRYLVVRDLTGQTSCALSQTRSR